MLDCKGSCNFCFLLTCVKLAPELLSSTYTFRVKEFEITCHLVITSDRKFTTEYLYKSHAIDFSQFHYLLHLCFIWLKFKEKAWDLPKSMYFVLPIFELLFFYFLLYCLNNRKWNWHSTCRSMQEMILRLPVVVFVYKLWHYSAYIRPLWNNSSYLCLLRACVR